MKHEVAVIAYKTDTFFSKYWKILATFVINNCSQTTVTLASNCISLLNTFPFYSCYAYLKVFYTTTNFKRWVKINHLISQILDFYHSLYLVYIRLSIVTCVDRSYMRISVMIFNEKGKGGGFTILSVTVCNGQEGTLVSLYLSQSVMLIDNHYCHISHGLKQLVWQLSVTVCVIDSVTPHWNVRHGLWCLLMSVTVCDFPHKCLSRPVMLLDNHYY